MSSRSEACARHARDLTTSAPRTTLRGSTFWRDRQRAGAKSNPWRARQRFTYGRAPMVALSRLPLTIRAITSRRARRRFASSTRVTRVVSHPRRAESQNRGASRCVRPRARFHRRQMRRTVVSRGRRRADDSAPRGIQRRPYPQWRHEWVQQPRAQAAACAVPGTPRRDRETQTLQLADVG